MHISRRQFIKAGAAGLGALAAEGWARNLPGPSPAPLSRIAFGSCLRNSANASALDQVIAARPDAFIWLGDNIYGDTEDMAVLKSKYDVLGANPRFQKLFAACPNLAIWDNHDYGYSRVGREHPKKQESQALFLDFWKIPAGDPRRAREGIYHAQVFGDMPRAVQIVLLDCRYFKTQTDTEPGATFLGETQWKWLADQLKVPAALRIVCSSIQVVPDEHGFDSWSVYPSQQQRLYNLIKSSKAGGVVFTSGDQHWAELSRGADAMGYHAWDLTASSLDQTWPLPTNRRRVGTATEAANFGIIEIEWEKADPLVHFRLQAATDGKVILDHPVALSTLHPWGPPVGIRKERGAAPNPRRVPEQARFLGRDLAGRKPRS